MLHLEEDAEFSEQFNAGQGCTEHTPGLPD
jgi:hypothetical protein